MSGGGHAAEAANIQPPERVSGAFRVLIKWQALLGKLGVNVLAVPASGGENSLCAKGLVGSPSGLF